MDARQAAVYWVQAANAAVVFRSGAEGQLSHNYSRALTVLFGEDQRAKMLGNMIGISVHDTRGLPA